MDATRRADASRRSCRVATRAPARFKTKETDATRGELLPGSRPYARVDARSAFRSRIARRARLSWLAGRRGNARASRCDGPGRGSTSGGRRGPRRWRSMRARVNNRAKTTTTSIARLKTRPHCDPRSSPPDPEPGVVVGRQPAPRACSRPSLAESSSPPLCSSAPERSTVVSRAESPRPPCSIPSTASPPSARTRRRVRRPRTRAFPSPRRPAISSTSRYARAPSPPPAALASPPPRDAPRLIPGRATTRR